MEDIVGFEHFYDAQALIRFWNEELLNKGAVTVDDLEGFLCCATPYDDNMIWTNLLTINFFKRDKNGIYILMLPKPNRPKF